MGLNQLGHRKGSVLANLQREADVRAAPFKRIDDEERSLAHAQPL